MAFKIAGSMAFKDAMESCHPVLMEPIMTVSVLVPEDAVGDVIGDLNSRRGRPLGMEPKGALTEVKAEVPMAELLSYAPDLRAITAGRGEYSMELARYEEVPSHLAQQVVDRAQEEQEAVKA
jgi:elongation factor G